MSEEKPFWETKPLALMSPSEWESLCDGCGKCCLVKLEDEDTSETFFTDVACKQLNTINCQCKDYPNRKKIVPECIIIEPQKLDSVAHWLPPSCAYRRLADGKPLPTWHPLITGDPNSVHEAGMSARCRVMSEIMVPDDDLPDHIATWPLEEKD